jgi:hypothetical protein
MEPEIKVTHIKNRYHARCFLNGKLVDEMACQNQQDIQVICREMLRWLHKLSIHVSNYTDRARHRQSSQRGAIGKIWYKNELDKEKERRITTATT